MVNQKLKKYVKATIYIGLILVTLWFVYKFLKNGNQPTIELFDINTDKRYGNLLVNVSGNKNSNQYNEATKQVVRLPGRFKLTGFKVSGVVLTQITVNTDKQIWVFSQNPKDLFSNVASGDIAEITQGGATYYAFKSKDALVKLFPKDIDNITETVVDTDNKYFALSQYIEPTFKLSMVADEVDINNPEKHISVMIDNNPNLKLNQEYNDYKLFDNDDKTAKYAGSILIISQSFADSLSTRPVYLTGWEIYGLAPYAPSWVDYSVMEKLTQTAVTITSTSPTTVDLTSNKKIYYLSLNGNSTATHTDYNIKLQYKNKLDNLTNVYSINGPVQLAFSNSSQYIFFEEPFIASQILITSSLGSGVSVDVYGVNASQKDENTFKLEQGKYDSKGLIVEGQKCPNVGQMMRKQLQAQQICEALEQKDRIRNKKASYERDKAYLKKLAEQDQEIKQLADKITNLIEKKNARVRESNISGDAAKLDAELEKIQALRREAEEYMKKPDVASLDVNVNLEPDLDLDYIKKNINL